ncbi:STAS domain-containing protein [uncultured Sphingomonas sp.]|uniref:STAS domain-containing protein n=1 Tax=uncultured Sphingomonas sp. TaxID=158754 RepID=UPI0025D4937F|nr:STAS domain-containing protein [uncultured Sphingomonas sp.]
MEIPLQPLEAEGAVALPAHGSTVTAADLQTRLIQAVDGDGPVEVDASQVESVGQAVLQLLVAAKAEAEKLGKAFTILNPSTAFTDRVNRCQLAAAVGIDTGDLL